jgi:2-polyprenyl-3-methyl-5-hydroxy-6-metoxy-1,4-benzoquinol methylase
MMDGKTTFESLYSKEDPWNYINTVPDRIRRAILLKHIEFIFSDGARKTVLDAGCGEGYIARDVASKYNADVDAFDISENALATARKRNPLENINYFQVDFHDYAPARKYDLILCEEALYYLADDKRMDAIKKFRDSTEAGGHLRLTSIIQADAQDGKYFSHAALKEIVAGNGFQPVSTWPSVIQKSSAEKVFYRLLEFMNKRKPVSAELIEYLAKLTLKRPLNNCRAISLLAKKV